MNKKLMNIIYVDAKDNSILPDSLFSEYFYIPGLDVRDTTGAAWAVKEISVDFKFNKMHIYINRL